MKRKRLVQGILWGLTAVWTGVILYLTLQNGPDTAKTSEGLAAWLHRLLTSCGIAVEFEAFHMMLRTLAHFGVFFVFGLLFETSMLVSLNRICFSRAYLPALLAGSAISIIPEVMKLWIPGRHLQWDEVGLNIAGAWIGALGVYLIFHFIGLLMRKKKNESNL